jgi:soluble lytic murein transglycosylase-like protein
LVNGLLAANAGPIQPEESSTLAYSEQLRIYDQPVPVARIVIPTTRPAARRAAPAVRRTAAAYQPLIEDVAARYDIDPDLIRSIAHVESGHNPRAVSPKGAQGLMQVMPATAKRFGVAAPDLADPAVNLGVAAQYLKTLQGLYGNNLPLILAAYNAGEGAVQKYGRTIPPYGETQAYVRRVLNLYGESLARR